MFEVIKFAWGSFGLRCGEVLEVGKEEDAVAIAAAARGYSPTSTHGECVLAAVRQWCDAEERVPLGTLIESF